MKSFLKSLNFTYIIIAVVLASSLVGVVVYRENVEQARIDAESLREGTELFYREAKLEECLIQADIEHLDLWLANCENHGFNIDKDDFDEITNCSLPEYNVGVIDGREKDDKDNCFEMYK